MVKYDPHTRYLMSHCLRHLMVGRKNKYSQIFFISNGFKSNQEQIKNRNNQFSISDLVEKILFILSDYMSSIPIVLQHKFGCSIDVQVKILLECMKTFQSIGLRSLI